MKNGDQWIVVRRFDDGSLAVRRVHSPQTSKVLTLAAAYVAAHVELTYATTAHRAQGDTVDTAHALVRPEMFREVLYVAMTRARNTNTAYVCTDTSVDDEHGPDEDEMTTREVLEQVLARTGADLSAHETIRAEHEKVGSIAQLAAEYDTIAREARRDSPAPKTARARGMIAGLIPVVDHIADPEIRQALAERAALIERRAEALLARAIEAGEPWLARLGPRPADPALRAQWEHAAATVAAYRDRHGVTDAADPFGEPAGGGQWTRRADRRRAQAAALEARQLALTPTQTVRPTDQLRLAARDHSREL